MIFPISIRKIFWDLLFGLARGRISKCVLYGKNTILRERCYFSTEELFYPNNTVQNRFMEKASGPTVTVFDTYKLSVKSNKQTGIFKQVNIHIFLNLVVLPGQKPKCVLWRLAE